MQREGCVYSRGPWCTQRSLPYPSVLAVLFGFKAPLCAHACRGKVGDVHCLPYTVPGICRRGCRVGSEYSSATRTNWTLRERGTRPTTGEAKTMARRHRLTGRTRRRRPMVLALGLTASNRKTFSGRPSHRFECGAPRFWCIVSSSSSFPFLRRVFVAFCILDVSKWGGGGAREWEHIACGVGPFGGGESKNEILARRAISRVYISYRHAAFRASQCHRGG